MEVMAAIVGDDGVLHGIFQLRLVEVDEHVHLLAADELHEGEGGPFREEPVGATGPSPV